MPENQTSMDAFGTRPFDVFEPTDGDPWDVHKAGHLIRRCAFGATPDELNTAVADGTTKTIDALFNFDPEDDPHNHLLEEMGEVFRLDNHRRVQEWWVFRMLRTDRPLQERIALFWHNHFATGGSKVNQQRMHKQIELFRRKGLGSFRELLVEVGRDPAMLLWLDGNNAAKGKPNENYAREIMELFTLGVDNGYTEADIKELSRCFTGWRVQGNNARFFKDRFDDGEKTILGKTGNFNDEGAVDLLLATEQAPKFIAEKLLTHFLTPTPPQPMIDHFAGRLTANDWHIGTVLKEMFRCRAFYSDGAYRSLIKDPATLCIGAGRALGGTLKAEFVREFMGKMGMRLLFPPDVSGWTGGEAWVNAATILVRYRFALEVARQEGRWYAKSHRLEHFLPNNNLDSADSLVDHYADLLLDGNLPGEVRSKLVDYFMRNDKNEPIEEFKLNGNTVRKKVKGTLHLMMTTPYFQLA
ncbi:MAG: DUF1800 domain-containing protein [Planctomycetota bacterium]